MSEIQSPKKRKFWQLHLSTAVLLMFAAGGWSWLNIQESHHLYGITGLGKVQWSATYTFGFPAPICEYQIDLASYPTPNPSPKVLPEAEDLGVVEIWRRGNVNLTAVVFNILSGGLILLIIAITVEFLYRRREGHKP